MNRHNLTACETDWHGMLGNRKIFSTRHDLHNSFGLLTRKIRIDKLRAEEYGAIGCGLALVLVIVSISVIILSIQFALAQESSGIMKDASSHKSPDVNKNTLTRLLRILPLLI